MKKLKIGICGWGTVATALYKCIETNSEYIQQKENLDIEVVVIGARRDNPDCDPKGKNVERDIYNVLNHDIDVLIELIGGISDAKKLISTASKRLQTKSYNINTKNPEYDKFASTFPDKLSPFILNFRLSCLKSSYAR